MKRLLLTLTFVLVMTVSNLSTQTSLRDRVCGSNPTACNLTVLG